MQISQLKEAMQATSAEQTRVQSRVQRVEDKWLPALQSLVHHVNQRFSASFDRMGCAGEVRLSRDPDYEKWGIDILVKFRDTEQLQLLTGQRQSGGVRTPRASTLLTARNARCPPSSICSASPSSPARRSPWWTRSTRAWTHVRSARSTTRWSKSRVDPRPDSMYSDHEA